MNVMIVGLSHQCAPMEVLERCALSPTAAEALGDQLLTTDIIHEAAVLATCNRVEVYVAVEMFHAGVEVVSQALADAAGIALDELSEHLFVRYGQSAIEHTFNVTAGLDSMAVGESQIIGQVRTMLQRGQTKSTIGAALDPLLQRALHVAKRVHTETDLAQAGPSLVEGAIEHAANVITDLSSATAVVVGAGGMSGLVLATLARRGITNIVVINRSADRAQRLAKQYGAHWAPLSDAAAVTEHLIAADLVFSCTGAQGYVITADDVSVIRSQVRQSGPQRPQVFVDLALPRDIDPDIDSYPGVVRLDLEQLGKILADRQEAQALFAAHNIVAAECSQYAAAQRTKSVGPTLAALQRRADAVVAEELDRLTRRLGPEVSPEVNEEIALAVRRVANKLLHTPTVRMKSLIAGQAVAPDYVSAVRNLFDLDHIEDTKVAQVQPQGIVVTAKQAKI